MTQSYQKTVCYGLLGWCAVNLAALALAPHTAPFDWPGQHRPPSGPTQVLDAHLVLAEVTVLALLAWLLTRRSAPALPARTPAARMEVLGLLGYGLMVQLLGAALGVTLGAHPISFHLAGSVVGTHDPVGPTEAWVWAGYNCVAYAVIPLVWFRRRYSARSLWLRSQNRRRDARVIVVVLAVEATVQLLVLGAPIVKLDGSQLLLGVPLTFLLYLLGTGLPTLVFVQAILVPRYAQLTGSTAATVLLGGLTYAGLHAGDAWTMFGSVREVATSLVFVLLLYAVPGMFKTFLTLRTGNAWVHLWAYHAIAPHTLLDTPLVVRVFRL